VEGEQAARGISMVFEELLIGTTALHLGYRVRALNARHLQFIPGLSVVQL
jgi:predicted nucleic acid-binding protein